MTTTQAGAANPTITPSHAIARELRGELGRQGISMRTLASRLHITVGWVSRRIGTKADVDLSFEDAFFLADSLGVEREAVLWWALNAHEENRTWAPWDSNPQPRVWERQTRAGVVVDLAAERARRSA